MILDILDNIFYINSMNRFGYLLQLSLLLLIASCSYDLGQSKSNAYYAAITHCPSKEIESWTCKLCPNVSALVNVTYIENTKTHIVGFGGYHPSSKSIIFSFRSTVDFINFFEDVTFLKVPLAHCKACEIHLGFY
jgi:hypothetical protein